MEADSAATLQWQGEEFSVPKSLLEDVCPVLSSIFFILVYYFVEGSFYWCGIT